MATIPTYTASVGLQRTAMPDSRLAAPEAQALQQVGAAVEDAASVFQQRQQQRDNFKAENAARKFELDLGAGLEDSVANAPEDGEGFHDAFLENVFKPRRDEFLAKIPERLRPRYAAMYDDAEGAGATEWSIKAAGKERDIATVWTKNEIKQTQDLMANAISQNPADYELFHQSGLDQIDSAPHLTATERKVAKQEWDDFAGTAYLNRMLEDDPQLVLRELGANPNKLSPATQFDVLKDAVRWQETRGKANQISPAGAVGDMQVMPGTAREIAKEIGDKNFPHQGDPEQVTAYLLRPGVSDRYGEHYLKKMMKQNPNDLEAALIAYNGGQKRANAWIKAGRDDSVLPTETANYYKEITARLPGLTAPGSQGTAAARKVEFIFNREGMAAIAGQSVDKLAPDLVDRVSGAFGALGIDKIKINSGFRDPADNARVGGAKKSQHLHGSAVDIDVSGYSHAQRIDIIKSLSANGITGLGIGANVIHADIGGRRVWGYPNVPKWAQGAVAEHMRGKAVPPRSGGRFATLSYDKRQSFIATADQRLSAKLTAEARGTALERVQMKQAMGNELALLANTGQPSGNFDEAKVSTVLGEDDYFTWAEKKAEAMKTFTAKQDIATMSPEEMASRLDDYKANPTSETFASDQKVEAAVVKEIERINKLRSSAPDKAAMEFPDVKEKVEAVREAILTNTVQSADVQSMVALMLEKQKEFGIPEKALAPVPREWAFGIGKDLTRVPETVGKNAVEVRAAVAAQYNELFKFFGEFTDEVIMYAISEYKGLSKSDVEQITALMERVSRGVDDPFRLKPRDTGEEQMSEPGFFDLEYWYKNTAEEPDDEPVEEQLDDAAAGAEPTPPSPELILRAVNALGSAETPEEEAAVEEQYGKAATDAARFKIEQGATQ